jgi:hypothetical protein
MQINEKVLTEDGGYISVHKNGFIRMSCSNRKPTHLYECPMAIQATCWCKPFMHEGLAFHRLWPGFLFWNLGEQGPTQTDRTDEGKP